MLSLRTVFIAWISCVLMGISWLFYLQSQTRKFQASLPIPPMAQGDDGTSGFTPKRVNFDQTAAVTRSTVPVANAAELRWERIQSAMSFEFTDQKRAYATLVADLRAVYADDPRVPRVLQLWMRFSEILREAESFESGGDLDAFLALAPSESLNAFFELSIELLKLNEADASKVRASVARLGARIDNLLLATQDLPDIQATVNTGEMTVDAAKSFFKNVYGIEVDIEISLAPKWR